jgi:hypothetical protein
VDDRQRLRKSAPSVAHNEVDALEYMHLGGRRVVFETAAVEVRPRVGTLRRAGA